MKIKSTLIKMLSLLVVLCTVVAFTASCGKSATTVTITVDGKTASYETSKETVKDLLDEQKIVLGEDDEVSPKLDSAISDGLKIVIKRVEYKTETRKTEIPFETKKNNSDSLEKGKTEVVTKGVKGEKSATYKVKYIDGKKDSEVLESEEVIKKAVDEVITVGTKQGKTIVSKQPVYNCNSKDHGYYVIKYSDGTTEYEEF